MNQESRYEKIARECYERVVRGAKGRFNVEDIKDALREEIAAHGLGDDAVDLLVEILIKKEDDRRARSPRHTGQLDLFTGDDDGALEAVWKLDAGERVQAQFAVRDDHARKLAVKKRNLDAVQDAYSREHREFSHLLPYYVDDTTTYAEALAAWRIENPPLDGGE